MPDIAIRPARIQDAPILLKFVHDLAREENAEHEVKTDLEQLVKTLFAKDATAHAVICETDKTPMGHAVYFFNYSTWQGKNGLYIEDLYLSPDYRNMGVGKKIIKYLAGLALEQDCGRMEWSVLNWNEPAIRFYESLGAGPQAEWIRYRLSGSALTQLTST
jgi:GNAT superfamily N-acetyltransferase